MEKVVFGDVVGSFHVGPVDRGELIFVVGTRRKFTDAYFPVKQTKTGHSVEDTEVIKRDVCVQGEWRCMFSFERGGQSRGYVE